MDETSIEMYGGPLDGGVVTGYSLTRPLYSYASAPKGMLHKYEPAGPPTCGPIRFVYRGVVASEEAMRGD